MKINDYRQGMDRIVPDPNLKERMMQNTNRKKVIPARRLVNGLLAAAVAAACLFTAAVAASPELRTAVLSFFRMEEHEQLPSGSARPDGPDISNAEIGALVKAQYIRMDSYRYGYNDGLLNDLTWSDDWKTLLDAKFWKVEDGELIPVEVELETHELDITYKGLRYQGEFYTFVQDNGELFLDYGDTRFPYGEDTASWNITTIPGRTDAVLLRISRGTQMEYTEYPLLYHLNTGEAEDILAGTGVDTLEYAYGYDWSENMRRAIILTGNHMYDEQTWFCDLDTNTLVRVNELVDIDIYTAAFGDNDTLILYSTTRDEDGILQDVSFYAYDIPTGHMTKTLNPTPYYRDWDDHPSGVMTFGSRCILISEGGQVQVVDLKTGNRSVLGGFTYQKGDSFQLNYAGDKLLYFAMNPNADGLGISQIGVADLEKGTFIAFDREGYETLYEGSIGWQDDNTVGINARTLDGETQYLLLYQF